jgi:hypothetical protein
MATSANRRKQPEMVASRENSSGRKFAITCAASASFELLIVQESVLYVQSFAKNELKKKLIQRIKTRDEKHLQD